MFYLFEVCIDEDYFNKQDNKEDFEVEIKNALNDSGFDAEVNFKESI